MTWTTVIFVEGIIIILTGIYAHYIDMVGSATACAIVGSIAIVFALWRASLERYQHDT